MQAVGVVCEYNPFHSGHALHLKKAREASGLPVVCVMSGNFVQRGEAAILRKFARAHAAVLCGADLVLELPLPWACAGAERFAAGGVGLLAATGVVSHLAFGSESGDAESIRRAAELLRRPDTDARLRAALSSGVSYAAARESAVAAVDPEAAERLKTPNDILAVAYVNQILQYGYPLTPIAVLREGAAHDGAAEGASASSSALREMLLAGGTEAVRDAVPEDAWRLLREEIYAGRAPVDTRALDTAVMSVLRRMDHTDFASLPDVSEGLEYRLARAAREAVDPADFCARVKTKRYAYARLRRICLAAFLGLTQELMIDRVPYARVLAFNDTGRRILREIRDLPVVTKAADWADTGGDAARVLAFEAAADDLYALAFPAAHARGGGQGYRESPVYVPGTHEETI